MKLKSAKETMLEAWREASEDLCLEIETPFYLESGKSKMKFDLLIKNFGSVKGTIIITTNDMSDFNKVNEFGFYCSALNPLHYNKYERENFIETLNDWGYFGEIENKPSWYNGYLDNEN
ncbi:MAG: hypothetical protein H7195_04350 [Chryseobacterium sp.]|nr:hypothetical protein [Chryseobacterium sp.]